MLRDTREMHPATGRQTMRPLPTEPLEMLRYALSEVEQTVCPANEVPSIVWTRDILKEGIILLKTERASVSPREQ